jgi:glycosyltransferase involved in cell wall biosynthesis
MWRGPRVVTVFDMTPELFPEYFRLGNPHFAKRKYCAVSDDVISISQNTADDMARLYSPAILDKTHTIPFGVGEQFFGPYTSELHLPERYLLFVGVRGGYKDFPAALEAWRALAQDDAELAFVVAGGGAFSAEEERLLESTGMRTRIHRVSPSDATMPELYERAEVFLFPSRYEGFGLPTLEALATGTPVVLADASCSREVGGEAALYFEPGDVRGLIARIREAQSASYRESAHVTGREWAKRFSWDRLAATTADLYRSTARKR